MGKNSRRLWQIQLRHKLQQSLGQRTATTRVACFHVGRCGSQALSDLLLQDAQVDWGDELFHHAPERYTHFGAGPDWAKAVIEDALLAGRKPIFGFETKAVHHASFYMGMSVPDYVQLLQQLGFNRYIFLERRNLLRVVVSSLIGLQTKTWRSTQTASQKRINLDVENPWGNGAGDLLETFGHYTGYYRDLDQLIQAPKLGLVYEDDIQDNALVAYEKLRDFLDLDLQQPTVRLKRMNPYPVRTMLENPSEVADYLSATPHAWMLEA